MQVQGKAFMVTGGGSGLGAATVERLIREGASVAILDLPNSDGEAKAGAFERAIFCPTDVTDPEQVTAAIDATVEAFGRIDGAISCAGIAAAIKVVSRGMAHDLSVFRQVIEVNLIGTFNVLRLVAAKCSENDPDPETGERGVVINTASIAAFDGQMGQTAYAASKGGVVGLTLPAARDLGRSGIRVMTIAPGVFDTRMVAMLPQEVKEKMGAQVPFPSRLGDPNEYAELALAILRNPMLNGETIRIDGALRMAPK